MPLASTATRSSYFPYFFRLFSFWLILFAAFRLIWLLCNTPELRSASVGTALISFVAGFKLDMSTIAYLSIGSFLLWVVYQFTHSRVIHAINQWYHYLLLGAFSVLFVCTIKMYHEWRALLNVGVFDYLKNPEEVVSFISTGGLLLLLLSILLWIAASIWVYRLWVRGFTYIPGRTRYKVLLIIWLPVIFIIAARGGFQLAPVNESAAYHSDKPFFNHLAINPIWYFIHSMLEDDVAVNPHVWIEPDEAGRTMMNLFTSPDSTREQVLTTTRPNLVFILLESWTADIIAALQGEPNVTPYFDSLRQQGLLFTNIYSAGARTEHGLISVLSGYPPPPKVSIITIPHKVSRLPNINSVLSAAGYMSSFHYGGEIGFANMKGFLIQSQFKQIIDKANFEKKQLNSKWGAHDEFVFQKLVDDLRTTPTPFFSVILTLSTHEPFEVPMETPFTGNDEADKFRKAAYYTDHCLREFFRNAKQQPWYDNTLFVLVADHGHRLPKQNDLDWPAAKRIPLLWFGEVIKTEFRGRAIDQIGNQHDLPATVLHQLRLDASEFPTSRDLLQPGMHEFAYYTTDNVMGWITPGQSFLYNYTTRQFQLTAPQVVDSITLDSLQRDAKVFLQVHFQRYLDF